MAEKTDNKKQPAPTLPVSVQKKQQHQQARADDVQLVNLWTFFNAVAVTISFGFSVAYTIIATSDPSLASSWLVPCAVTKTTDAVYAAVTQVSALLFGMLWFSTPQAAAGALALLLPSHRWRVRRAAAYAALALTVASHCMYAGAVRVLVRVVDPPGGHFFTVAGNAAIFICAVGDLLGFRALLRGEWAS